MKTTTQIDAIPDKEALLVELWEIQEWVITSSELTKRREDIMKQYDNIIAQIRNDRF